MEGSGSRSTDCVGWVYFNLTFKVLYRFFRSQIGRCHTKESYKKQQNLQKAMEEAKRLAVIRSPENISRATTPIVLPDLTGSDFIDLVRGQTSGL